MGVFQREGSAECRAVEWRAMEEATVAQGSLSDCSELNSGVCATSLRIISRNKIHYTHTLGREEINGGFEKGLPKH